MKRQKTQIWYKIIEICMKICHSVSNFNMDSKIPKQENSLVKVFHCTSHFEVEKQALFLLLSQRTTNFTGCKLDLTPLSFDCWIVVSLCFLQSYFEHQYFHNLFAHGAQSGYDPQNFYHYGNSIFITAWVIQITPNS